MLRLCGEVLPLGRGLNIESKGGERAINARLLKNMIKN